MQLQAYWNKAVSLEEYIEEHKQQVAANRASGLNQSDDYIRYTKLNYARLKRSLKSVELTVALKEALKKVTEPINLLVITETWCGDSAQNLAPLARIEEASENISVKVVERDKNLELIDSYLTNGGRAIPKVVAFNKAGDELFTWGPRPAKAQEMVLAWKNTPEPKDTYDEFSIKLQNWYNKNKGVETLNEVAKLLETTN